MRFSNTSRIDKILTMSKLLTSSNAGDLKEFAEKCNLTNQTIFPDLPILKLTDQNWMIWKKHMRFLLNSQSLWSLIRQRPVSIERWTVEYDRQNQAVLAIIEQNVASDLWFEIDHFDLAFDVWQALIERNEPYRTQQKVQLFATLFKFGDKADDAQKLGQQFKSISRDLHRLDVTLDDLLRYLFIQQLPSQLSPIKSGLHRMTNVSLNELILFVRDYERNLLISNRKSKLSFQSASLIKSFTNTQWNLASDEHLTKSPAQSINETLLTVGTLNYQSTDNDNHNFSNQKSTFNRKFNNQFVSSFDSECNYERQPKSYKKKPFRYNPKAPKFNSLVHDPI